MTFKEELEAFDKDMQALVRQGADGVRPLEEIAEEIREAHRTRYMEIMKRHFPTPSND